MFDYFSKGIVLEQKKEPAFSREILSFLNNPVVGASPVTASDPSTEQTLDKLIRIAKQANIIDERDGRLLYKKLLRAKTNGVKQLVADALDDEPYVSSQMGPLMQKPKEAVGGLNLLGDAFDCASRSIYLYRNLGELHTKIPKKLEGVLVERIGGKYPVEHSSMFRVERGTLIIGVCALIHLFRAVFRAQVHNSCFLTVEGNCIANPRNLEVSIGMTVAQVMERCGLSEEPNRVIIGGSMTGLSVIDPDNTVVSATTRAIIATREDEKDRRYTCIGCGRCLDCCPVDLNPMFLYKAIKHNKLMQAKAMEAGKCIGCGTCSYICPAKLDLAATIRGAFPKLEEAEGEEVKFEA